MWGTPPDLGGASRGGGTVDGSLYERLGGVDAITAVVRAVVDRRMKEDRINQKSARTNVDRLRQKA